MGSAKGMIATLPTRWRIFKESCLNCHRETFKLNEFFSQYGIQQACLSCGEVWLDGEEMPSEEPAESIYRARGYRRATLLPYGPVSAWTHEVIETHQGSFSRFFCPIEQCDFSINIYDPPETIAPASHEGALIRYLKGMACRIMPLAHDHLREGHIVC